MIARGLYKSIGRHFSGMAVPLCFENDGIHKDARCFVKKSSLVFKSVIPNYRKKVLHVVLQTGRTKKEYHLPFSVFTDAMISTSNRFERLEIDKELNHEAVIFELTDGFLGDFSADFVLYHCEPTFDWSPVNQIKRALRERFESAHLSVRVVAGALKTSPSQVLRLLEENRTSNQIVQLFKLAELAGYRLEFSLKKVA